MQLDHLKLPEIAAGNHEEGSGKMCAMELVAFMERLPHSDKPECTCPVLADYVRRINDWMPDGRRQDLLPVLSRLVGTVNPELEQKRAEHFAMTAVREIAPIALKGVIDDALVLAMQDAQNLKDARKAANAAAAKAAYTAAKAATAAAHAARAARGGNTVIAAGYSAVAADAAEAAADAGVDVWAIGIQLLVSAIELDPTLKPPVWSYERASEALKYCEAVLD